MEASQHSKLEKVDKYALKLAFKEASGGYDEGGIPIGAALVRITANGEFQVLGVGRNLRIQRSSATLHGETSALENAGRLPANVYRECTMYTTLSMCTGAILLYKIPRVVIGENSNFVGGEDLLRNQGVEVIVVDDAECKALMKKFIDERPEDWHEDIGENKDESAR